MVVALTILAIITPIITLYSVYMGLKWNIQLQKNEPLEKPFKAPQKKEPKEQAEAIDETQQIMQEWVYGGGDE